MTFCCSRAAAAKKWIKKRDLAITDVLFCLLNLLFLIFDVLVVAAVVAS